MGPGIKLDVAAVSGAERAELSGDSSAGLYRLGEHWFSGLKLSFSSSCPNYG